MAKIIPTSPISMLLQSRIVEWKKQLHRNFHDAHGLSHTEWLVLQLVASGLQYKEVAAVLNRSTSTVKKHIEALQRKTKSPGLSFLIRYAFKNGYISITD